MFNVINYPLIRWILSGGMAFIVDFLALVILVEFFDFFYLYATIVAFILSSSTNFLISRYLIFNATTSTITGSYIKFITVSIFGLIIITTLMYLLVSILNLHYLVSRLLIASTVGVSSFYLHKFITFNFKLGENVLNKNNINVDKI